MKLIVASNNPGKIKEIKDILRDLDIDVLSQNEAGFTDLEVEENGSTLEDNAMIKLEAIDTEEALLADDTGLYVDHLDGPGVRTARYAGEGASDSENRLKMLDELEGISQRQAKFVTVIVLKYKGKIYKAEGICKGHIAEEEKGENGFGYDPIFIPQGHDRTFAQMDDDTKNSLSHRKKALENIYQILERLANG